MCEPPTWATMDRCPLLRNGLSIVAHVAEVLPGGSGTTIR
jgi:hypothetical protein